MIREVDSNKLGEVLKLAGKLKALQEECEQIPSISDIEDSSLNRGIVVTGVGILALLPNIGPAAAHEKETATVTSSRTTNTLVIKADNANRVEIGQRQSDSAVKTGVTTAPATESPVSRAYKLHKDDTVSHVASEHDVPICGREVTTQEFIDHNGIQDARRLPIGYAVECPDDAPVATPVLNAQAAKVTTTQTAQNHAETIPSKAKITTVAPSATNLAIATAQKAVAGAERLPTQPNIPVVPATPIETAVILPVNNNAKVDSKQPEALQMRNAANLSTKAAELVTAKPVAPAKTESMVAPAPARLQPSVANEGLQQPVQATRVSSEMGLREHPITKEEKMHNGRDYAAPTGTPIVAVNDGVVVGTVDSDKGYGKQVIIRHGKTRDEKELTTRSAHMSAIDVKDGQSVEAGQKIGEVGSTGLSTGPHLHFEARVNGEPVNPKEYIEDGKKF